MRDVRRNGGGRGLCGRPGKRVNGVFPGRPQSFRHQRRPVDDCSPGRGGIEQDGGSRGGTFHGEIDRYRERIAQSKRARACSLALVDYSYKWRELVSSGRLVCRCHDVVLWCYVCFVLLLLCFVFVFILSLKPWPFVQSAFDMQAPR